MNFLSWVLFPFAVIYDLVTRFRNHLYNVGTKRSFEFQTNVISVGNLSVGGTGKSPMVEYLIRLFKNDFRLATLSRGYGRKTRGFRIASTEDSAKTVGDEPFQFYKKFDDVTVSVGEERAMAIPFILAEEPNTDIILLDDAYQHRPVKPSFSILLTDYSRPFFKDYLLPMGRLRESRKGAERADTVIVTKCTPDLSENDQKNYIDSIRKYNKSAPIFFSIIRYLKPQAVFEGNQLATNVLMFTGIANPRSLENHITNNFTLASIMSFNDHHRYSDADFEKIKNTFEKIEGEKIIITTEKDAVKLWSLPLDHFFRSLPVFYIPIETSFLKDGKRFDEIVKQSIRSYT